MWWALLKPQLYPLRLHAVHSKCVHTCVQSLFQIALCYASIAHVLLLKNVADDPVLEIVLLFYYYAIKLSMF